MDSYETQKKKQKLIKLSNTVNSCFACNENIFLCDLHLRTCNVPCRFRDWNVGRIRYKYTARTLFSNAKSYLKIPVVLEASGVVMSTLSRKSRGLSVFTFDNALSKSSLKFR